MYAIQSRHDLNMLDVHLSGMFSRDEVLDYARALATRFRQERWKPGYLMRLDVSNCTIQPQDVVNTFEQHMHGFPKAARIAVVTGSSLARMQVRRVMHQDYMRMFDTADAALEWLLDGKADAA